MSKKRTSNTKRPTCINHGCDKPVTHGGSRWRPVCATCHCASVSKPLPSGNGVMVYAKGVTPFRTGRCSNQDGHLGYTCAINYKKAPWAIGITEIDHIDGNHMNNTLKNVAELCPICHKQKSKLNGDHSRQNRYSSYKGSFKNTRKAAA